MIESLLALALILQRPAIGVREATSCRPYLSSPLTVDRATSIHEAMNLPGLETGLQLANACATCVISADTARRAERLMRRLEDDLGITRAAAAAVAAHALAESGIAGVNERHPVVPGSKGGIGYLQWTGGGQDGRRTAFEAFARLHGLSPASDEASIRFFEFDLQMRYPETLATLRRPGLTAAQQSRALQPYVFGADPGLNRRGAARAATAEILDRQGQHDGPTVVDEGPADTARAANPTRRLT